VFNARDVLALESVPVADRLRVVLREQLLPAWILRLFAADCTLRTLINVRRVGREPDQRSWDAVRVVRDYALGRATAEDLSAAWSAAWSAARSAAYAADAADRAAWSTSWAAYAADAWASEQEEQVARLLALLDAAQERDLAEWEE